MQKPCTCLAKEEPKPSPDKGYRFIQQALIMSYDEAGELISLEFLNASQREMIHPELTELKIDR